MILSVPCCQHELNRQLHCEELEPILGYGLIKERMAALMTDAIRAVRRNHMKYNAGKNHDKLKQMEELLHVRPTLQTLLEKE